ncbi:MAG: SRPBCC family protein [Acidimicrobiia bacterium]|nr:SRPBCC family protein [Acidimicrobiia bacterium]
MIQVTASVDIDRPASDVFDYLADMSNNPKWQRGMQQCSWTSEPPLRLGSTYDQQATFLGKQIISSFEVVEFEAGRRIRIKTTGGTMPIDVTREVRTRPDGTASVTATVRGESPGLLRLAGPLMRVLVAASVRGDYRRLKAVLESAG